MPNLTPAHQVGSKIVVHTKATVVERMYDHSQGEVLYLAKSSTGSEWVKESETTTGDNRHTDCKDQATNTDRKPWPFKSSVYTEQREREYWTNYVPQSRWWRSTVENPPPVGPTAVLKRSISLPIKIRATPFEIYPAVTTDDDEEEEEAEDKDNRCPAEYSTATVGEEEEEKFYQDRYSGKSFKTHLFPMNGLKTDMRYYTKRFWSSDEEEAELDYTDTPSDNGLRWLQSSGLRKGQQYLIQDSSPEPDEEEDSGRSTRTTRAKRRMRKRRDGTARRLKPLTRSPSTSAEDDLLDQL